MTEQQPVPDRTGVPRRSTERVVAGVAGGLAQHLGVSTRTLRLVFVFSSVFGGLGVLAYAGGWALMPDEDGTPAVGERALRWLADAPPLVQVFVAGVVALVVTGGSGFAGLGAGWGLLLIGVGVVVFRLDPHAAPPSSHRAAATNVAVQARSPVVQAPPNWRRRSKTLDADAPSAESTRPPGAVASVAPSSSRLGRLTLAAALVAGAGAATVDALGVFDVSVEEHLALALLMVGGGLLVGAWRGRARWLMAVGVLLVWALTVVNFVEVPLEGGGGLRTYQPESVAALRDSYQLGVGELTLDLSRLRPADHVRVDATLGAGALEIIVPPEVAVHVDGDVRLGVVEAFGEPLDRHDGLWSGSFVVSDDAALDAPRLDLDVNAGVAVVLLRRGAPEGSR